MKVVWRGLAALVMVLLIVAGGVWAYLGLRAQQIFNDKIGSLTQRKVSTRSVYPSFPSGIVARDVRVEGLALIPKLRMDVEPAGLLRGRINITSVRLDQPVIFVAPQADGPLGGQAAAEKVPDVPSVTRAKIILRRLVIHDGTICWKTPDGVERVLERVQADLSDVPVSGEPVRTNFSATASLRQLNIPFVGHFVRAEGWINWAGRAMDAFLQTVDDDGRTALSVRLTALNNDLLVEGQARLARGQQAQASGQASGLLESVVLSALDAAEADVEAGFSFHTAMDRPRIGRISLRGNITTDLNSEGSSSNIVQSLKALAEQFLKDDADTAGTK